jgi:hypothetical protein
MALIRQAHRDDLGVISNYVLDEARKNGVSIPPTSVLRNLSKLIDELGGVVIELGDKIVGFALWEKGRENWLVSFYIADGYRANKKVLTGLYGVVVKEFDGKILRYRPLHNGIDKLRYCVNGRVDLEHAKKDLEKLV